MGHSPYTKTTAWLCSHIRLCPIISYCIITSILIISIKLINYRVSNNSLTDFIPISEAKKMRSQVNVEAIVKSKGDPRTVNLPRGGTIQVCDAIIVDGETADDQMDLTLWGSEIDSVNIGDVVVITNGYTKVFNDRVSLTAGKYGQMKINP